MRGAVGALLTAVPGMASIIGLMGLVLYVSAVIATQLFGTIAPDFFGSIGASLFTLFQVMTVKGWPDIARLVMAQAPYAWIFFVIYLLVATSMVLNLFIAVVVVNTMQTQVADEMKGEEEAHTEIILREIRALRKEIGGLRGDPRVCGRSSHCRRMPCPDVASAHAPSLRRADRARGVTPRGHERGHYAGREDEQDDGEEVEVEVLA